MKWQKVFDHPIKGRETESQLLNLRQGSQPVSQYAITFCILAVESDWNNCRLKAAFLKGLSGEIKDELAVRDDPPSLNQLIDLAIQLDNRIKERHKERANRQGSCPFISLPSSHAQVAPLTSSSPSSSSKYHSRTPVPEPQKSPCSWELTPTESKFFATGSASTVLPWTFPHPIPGGAKREGSGRYW